GERGYYLMWQVIKIVSTKAKALEIENFLSTEGFLIQLDEMSGGEYQIKVPQSEADDVYEALKELNMG
ncbi:MAG: hypothetical protein ACOCQB_02785, partial [Halanaerobiaceae bacterium]